MAVRKYTNKKKIKTKKISMEIKIALYGIIMGAFICSMLSVLAYNTVSKTLISNVTENTMALAEIAAGRIDGDLFEKLEPGDENSEAYQVMLKELFSIFKDDDVYYAYSFRRLNSDRVEFVVAADPEGKPCKIGDIYKMIPEMREAFNGNTAVTENVVSDIWGTFYTSYAPIYNSKGRVVGIVGVDTEVTYIQAKLKDLIKKDIIASCICIAVVIVSTMIFSRRLGSKLFKMNQELEQMINSQDKSAGVKINSGDELEVIADNINSILDNMRVSMKEIKASSSNLKARVGTFTEGVNESMGQIAEASATVQEICAAMEQTGKRI